jgi:hypothetical protein
MTCEYARDALPKQLALRTGEIQELLKYVRESGAAQSLVVARLTQAIVAEFRAL